MEVRGCRGGVGIQTELVSYEEENVREGGGRGSHWVVEGGVEGK